MKVLQINSVCGIRSTGRICTDIAQALRARGDDCRIGYGREEAASDCGETAVRISCANEVKLHALYSRLSDHTGFASKRATERFLQWVEAYDPDVIHLHNLHGYYLHIGLLFDYLKKAGKPVVWTLHDCWAFTGHCAHFDYIGCRKWEDGGCGSCPQIRTYPASLFRDRSEKNFLEKRALFTGVADLTLVAPSTWLADVAQRSFLSEYPVRVIRNGIDLSVFRPTASDFRERYGLQGKTILLGVASAWTDRKGLADFVRLRERLSDNEVIVLVGLSAQQVAALPSDMIGIECTDSIEELAAIYSAADVFVNPTYEEVFGLVNIEAQACGVPVVTYASGGSPEGVPSEYVVPRGDLDGLYAMIRRVLAEPTPLLCDVRPFAKEERYQDYITLYQECGSKRND